MSVRRDLSSRVLLGVCNCQGLLLVGSGRNRVRSFLLEMAAHMLCADSTVWRTLRDHGTGLGKRIGVIGAGGLGCFALGFAKALKRDGVFTKSCT